MDYSDMSYYDIVELLDKHKYELPVIASDVEGNQTVLTDGWTETTYEFEPARMHYYKLVTYLDDGSVQTDYFSADGIHSVHIQPAQIV